MIICQCDRCGKTYKPEDNRFTEAIEIFEEDVYTGVEEGEKEHVQLCHDCITKISDWLRSKDEKEEIHK